MNDKEIKRYLEARLEESTWEDTVITGFMSLIVMVGGLFALGRMMSAGVRVPVIEAGVSPVAGSVGVMWLQPGPGVSPRELRIISENSTGAFERMLLGLST